MSGAAVAWFVYAATLLTCAWLAFVALPARWSWIRDACLVIPVALLGVPATSSSIEPEVAPAWIIAILEWAFQPDGDYAQAVDRLVAGAAAGVLGFIVLRIGRWLIRRRAVVRA